MSGDKILLEDASGFILLEGQIGFLILEESFFVDNRVSVLPAEQRIFKAKIKV